VVKRRRVKAKPQVIVVGAGVSGLTAAAYLGRRGYAVTVFEQFNEVGGVTATLEQNGFRWDLGPLLLEGFAPDERAGRILSDLGIAEHVPLLINDRLYAFPDFDLRKPDAYGGPLWRRERLKQLFPSEKQGIEDYYRFYNRVMNALTLNTRAELARGPIRAWLKLRLLLAFGRIKDKVDWSAAQLMDDFFVDPRLKAIFTSILADLVVPPSRFPALGIPSLNTENAFDLRIPRRQSSAGKRPSYHFIKGGCGTLVEALADVVRANGGQIYTSTAIDRILVDADRVTGVVAASGQTVTSDIVVATGGARRIFLEAVGRQYLPLELAYQVDELPLMESVLMVHLGVDLDPREYQPDALCYYYGTYDIEGSVNACRKGQYHEGNDGFVLYVPTAHSPEMAPAGQHALTAYTIAPNVLDKGDWVTRRDELAGKLIDQVEKVIPAIRDHIITQVVLTPPDFAARTHLQHHAFGGRVPVMGSEGPGYETPIAGLWFVGAQSKSGGGVQNAMVGAREAALSIAHRRRHRRRRRAR